jgi:hypothetical protein
MRPRCVIFLLSPLIISCAFLPVDVKKCSDNYSKSTHELSPKTTKIPPSIRSAGFCGRTRKEGETLIVTEKVRRTLALWRNDWRGSGDEGLPRSCRYRPRP